MNIMPHFGTVRENEAAFAIAVSSINSGDREWGRSILVALRDHIWQTEEQKSVQWILPKVLATLDKLKTCTSPPTVYVREEYKYSGRCSAAKTRLKTITSNPHT